MHTEEESKTKWCPNSGNPNNKEYNRCAGSDCMAWRWGETKNEVADGVGVFEQGVTRGYCGLAGKA